MNPPAVPPTVPPSRAPGKPLATFDSLIGNPFNDEGDGGTASFPGPLTIRAKGKPPLILNRTETVAPTSPDVLEILEFERDGHVAAALGLDSLDHLVVLAKDKTTVLMEFDTDASQEYAVNIPRDAVAGVNPHILISRSGTPIGYLGTDASDHVAFIAADGLTVIAFLTDIGDWEVAGHVRAGLYQDVNGTQVLSTQQPAIPDATPTSGSPAGTDSAGGAPTDPAFLGDVDGVYGVTNGFEARIADLEGSMSTAISTLNTILSELRAATGHGVIA